MKLNVFPFGFTITRNNVSSTQAVHYLLLHETSWEDWMRDAERDARTAGWDNEMTIRFFGDRLKHMAEEIIRRWAVPSYAYWKNAMAERFHDKSAKETYKRALQQLKQSPNQRVQDFGNQIDKL
jgi:GrpB-like predicted nucleotidyltransferase (UPF0157 family)